MGKVLAATRDHVVDITGWRLNGARAKAFYEEAKRRGVVPSYLAARLLEAVIDDDLYDAVLDADE